MLTGVWGKKDKRKKYYYRGIIRFASIVKKMRKNKLR